MQYFRCTGQRQSRQNVCRFNALSRDKGAEHRNKEGLRCSAPLSQNLALNATDVLAALPLVFMHKIPQLIDNQIALSLLMHYFTNTSSKYSSPKS
jgi:hypothetical protein